MNPSLIRRCLWCEKRIGQARAFIDGQWTTEYEEEKAFTDGICVECAKEYFPKQVIKIDERSVLFKRI